MHYLQLGFRYMDTSVADGSYCVLYPWSWRCAGATRRFLGRASTRPAPPERTRTSCSPPWRFVRKETYAIPAGNVLAGVPARVPAKMSRRSFFKDLDPDVFMTAEPLRELRDGFRATGSRSDEEANGKLAEQLAAAFFTVAHRGETADRSSRTSDLRRKWRLQALQRKVATSALKAGITQMLSQPREPQAREPRSEEFWNATAWMKLYNNTDPVNGPRNRNSVLWAEWLESSRKDIERFFGVLKARWRVLKVPFNMTHIGDIDRTVRACIVLHNWYHDWRLKKEREFAADPAAAMGVVDGAFSPYSADEREILEANAAARVANGEPANLRMTTDGEQVVFLGAVSRSQFRVAVGSQYDSTLVSGVADADAESDTFGERVSDGNNARRPPDGADADAAGILASVPAKEQDRFSAKRAALAQHVHYLSRTRALRWKTYTRAANMPTGRFLDIGARLMQRFRARHNGSAE